MIPEPTRILGEKAYKHALDDEARGYGSVRFHGGVPYWHPGEQTRFQPEESDPWVP